MSPYMTAAQSRELLHGSMRPRSSHVTPLLTARLAADLDEQIEAARGYAVAMIRQSNHVLAGYGFTEATRMGKRRECYAGGSDASSHDPRR